MKRCFCYKCRKCGSRFEVMLDSAERHVTCERCGAEAGRDYKSEHQLEHSGGHGYPFYSDSAGIDPANIREVTANLRSKGVSCEFDREGRPKMESHYHRKKVLKALGLVDMSSYN